jgi:hypothetical protein
MKPSLFEVSRVDWFRDLEQGAFWQRRSLLHQCDALPESSRRPGRYKRAAAVLDEDSGIVLPDDYVLVTIDRGDV